MSGDKKCGRTEEADNTAVISMVISCNKYAVDELEGKKRSTWNPWNSFPSGKSFAYGEAS